MVLSWISCVCAVMYVVHAQQPEATAPCMSRAGDIAPFPSIIDASMGPSAGPAMSGMPGMNPNPSPAARPVAARPSAKTTAMRLCAMSKDTFAGNSVPSKPTLPLKPSGGILPNTPIENPCSSLFELLYKEELYTAAHVFRVGLGRESTMLFDPFTAITLLAPSDKAFAKMNITENSVPDPTWKAMAEAHLLPGTITSRDIACSKRDGSFTLDAQTWNTRDVTLRINPRATLVKVEYADGTSSAQVTKADVAACLSVLHVLDRAMAS